MNVAAAIYVTVRIQNRNDEGLKTKSTIISRITHLLCYDPIIAIYIVMLIVFFVWQCYGASQSATRKFNPNGTCTNDVDSVVQTSIGFGFGFYGAGFIALCISYCCALFDGGHYGNDDTVYHVNSPGVSSPSNQNGNIGTYNYGNTHNNPTAPDIETQIPIATPVPNDFVANNAYNTNQTSTNSVKPSAPPFSEYHTSSTSTNYTKNKNESIGDKVSNFLNLGEGTSSKASVAINSSISAAKKIIGSTKK